MPLGFIAKGIAAGAKALAKKGVIRGSVGKALGGSGVSSKKARQLAKKAAAAGAVGVAVAPYRKAPPLPPLPTTRTPGIAGTIQRALPGGKSGYQFEAMPDAAVDKMGRPMAVRAEYSQRVSCPPGYVAVDLDGDGVKDACVLKGVARAAGVWKGRPKPPVSAADARAISRAARAQDRVKRLAGNVGLKYCPPKSGAGKFKKKK